MVTDGTVLSDYLYHNLRNRYEEIRSMCAIADGRGGLNLKIVGSIKVIVPSIEEQRQFVAFAEQTDKSKFIDSNRNLSRCLVIQIPRETQYRLK